jgi:hypothetical protein
VSLALLFSPVTPRRFSSSSLVAAAPSRGFHVDDACLDGLVVGLGLGKVGSHGENGAKMQGQSAPVARPYPNDLVRFGGASPR